MDSDRVSSPYCTRVFGLFHFLDPQGMEATMDSFRLDTGTTPRGEHRHSESYI